VDGSEINAVRRRCWDRMAREVDDLSDMELMNRSPADLWYLDLCVDQLHRLPSEIDPIILCREYTALQARAIVKRAQTEMTRTFAK